MKFHSVVFVFSMLFIAIANAYPMANDDEYQHGLKLDFYKHSCPNAEKIVERITKQYVSHVPSFAAGLIKMIFHDCAVRGCDASLLLNPTATNNATEKTAVPNSTLRGFVILEAIKSALETECPGTGCDASLLLNPTATNNATEKTVVPNSTLRGFVILEAIKSALETECPGTVSCADILALSSRDAITTINGPWWEVPTGRRDGMVSMASEANALVPSPFANITTLKQNFAALGLNTKDLVVLSGAHTIGVGHCFIIRNRLYNFTGNGDTDPTLSPGYAKWLKTRCSPDPADLTSFVAIDKITSKAFDEKYYTMVTQNRGLFSSDAALLNDQETKSYIETQAKTMGSTFDKDFAESMTKMVQIGVLTGSQGEIRKNCGLVNP